MSKERDRSVYYRDNGKWVSKRNDKERGDLLMTQSDAVSDVIHK